MCRRVAQAQADQIARDDASASEAPGKPPHGDVESLVGERFAAALDRQTLRLALRVSGDQVRDVHWAAAPLSVVAGEKRRHRAREFVRHLAVRTGEDIMVLALDDNRLEMRDQRGVAFRMQDLVGDI
jgi:hypothetical protein